MPGGFKAILAGAVAALAGLWRRVLALARRAAQSGDSPEETPEERADRQDRQAW